MIKTVLIYDYGDSKKETVDSKEFPKPKKYEDFISNIAKSFKIKKKKEINLMVFTTDGDEIPIQDQEDLESYNNEASEYRVIIEKNESEKPQPSISSSGSKAQIKKKKEDSVNDDEEDDDDNKSQKDEDETKKFKKGKNQEVPNKNVKKEDSNSENEGDEDDDEIDIKLNINLELSEKEIENLIEGQIKNIPEIDNNIINDDLQFNIEEFKKKLNNKNNSIIKEFNKSFDSKINDIVMNKSNIMKQSINNSVLNFSQININNLTTINKDTNEIKEEFNEMFENSSNLNDALEKLKGEINAVPNLNPKPLINPKTNPIRNQKPPKNSIDDEEDEDDNKLTIRFEKENINLETERKKAGSFEIENIIIENIGNKEYKSLCFVEDENQSSKDINFSENSKNIKVHKLSLDGPFTQNKKESHTFNVHISNPNPNQMYTLCIYVKENENGKNLSKPLKINVKIKDEPKEDPQKILEENAKKLLAILEKQYENQYNLSILCPKEELLKKIIEQNNNKNSINEWIEKEFEKKADELFGELKLEDFCDEREAKAKIYELKFDKQQIIKWKKELEENKIEILYKELNDKLNISEKISKNEVLDIIKENNFEKEGIIKLINSKMDRIISVEITNIKDDPKKPDPKPVNPSPDDKRVEELMLLFDEEYNILNIIDEDEFRQKIIELNREEDKIREWIVERLSSLN